MPTSALLCSDNSKDIKNTQHKACMKRALAFAQKAHVSDTLPNPRVGAVVVKNDRVISTGYHKERRALHAECDALGKLSSTQSRGATLYCTLEPCCAMWKGKRHPPCTDAIVSAGIKSVYIASCDPNPMVRGRGIALLQKHGVHVEVLTEYGEVERSINEAVHALYASACFEDGMPCYTRPFVHAKVAQSMDARLAAQDGSSAWITNMRARTEVHRMRSETHMLCSGVGTVLADNPRYSVRHVSGLSPALAIIDSNLKTPPKARVFQAQRREPGLVVYTTERGYENNAARYALEQAGARVVCVDTTIHEAMSRVSLTAALRHLLKLGVHSLMVEAGATLTNAFFDLHLIDKLSCFIAPLFLGGAASSLPYAVGPHAVTPSINAAQRLMYATTSVLEGDARSHGNCFISGYMHDIFSHN